MEVIVGAKKISTISVKGTLKSTGVVAAFLVGSFVMCRVGAKLREHDRQRVTHSRFLPVLFKGTR